jgi:hypothetical protein
MGKARQAHDGKSEASGQPGAPTAADTATVIALDLARIDISAATITDSQGTRPLANGLGITPGDVTVAGIVTDQDCPLSAVFIPDDEAVTYPGTGTRTGAGPFTWTFTWTGLPELGSNAVLRIEELCLQDETGNAPLGFSGGTVTITVHIFDSFDEDPEDIGPL